MSKPAHTHKLRPKAANAKWERVTTEELAQIKAQVGERTFKANYELKELPDAADEPTPPPAKLATTTSKAKAGRDEAPVTPPAAAEPEK